MTTMTGQCSCGAVRFETTQAPALRAFCHCTICQAFNQAPYADITVFRSPQVHVEGESAVEFQAYRRPPNVQRGRCRRCGDPIIERLHLPGPLALTFIPSPRFDDATQLPNARLHMFYNRRVENSDDKLPKYNGYWGSQLGFLRHFTRGAARLA